MTKYRDLPNFAAELKELLQYERKQPPVDSWHPSREGEIDITIRRDGSWWYQGDEMTREATIQLFSRILRKEGDNYFLVSPVEKLKINIELLPFVVRIMDVEGEGKDQRIIFSTNVGDTFEVSPEHPMCLMSLPGQGEAVPVVTVRRGLSALISRQVYYGLAEHAVLAESEERKPASNTLDGQSERYGLWSCGKFFEL